MSYEFILLRGAFLQDCGEMGKGQTEADSRTRGRPPSGIAPTSYFWHRSPLSNKDCIVCAFNNSIF